MEYNRFELSTVMGINAATFIVRVGHSPPGDALRTHTGPAGKQMNAYAANSPVTFSDPSGLSIGPPAAIYRASAGGD